MSLSQISSANSSNGGVSSKPLHSKSAESTPKWWSDADFDAELGRYWKVYKRSSQENAAQHAIVFLNWYTGKTLREEALITTIQGLWSFLDDGDKIFPDSLYDSTKDEPKPADDISIVHPIQFKFLKGQQIPLQHHQKYQEWYTTLYSDLTKSSDVKEFTSNVLQKSAIYYLGILALHLMRLIYKDPYKTSLRIMNTTELIINKFFKTWRMGSRLYPPSGHNLLWFHKNFAKRSVNSKKLLTGVIQAWREAKLDRRLCL